LPRARRARMAVDRMAEFGGRLELRFLPPHSPELNPDELVWQDLKTNRVGRKPVESAKELHERVPVHMETFKGLPRKVRSFFKATHTKYAAGLCPLTSELFNNVASTPALEIGLRTSPDWLDFGELNWSLFGGPGGFQEKRLGRIVSFPWTG